MKKISGVDTVELRIQLMSKLERFVDKQIRMGTTSRDAVQAVREALADVKEEWK
jgi:hypothetical protein